MDIYEIGDQLKYVGTLLETIRTLSKEQAIDYQKEPYDNDMHLLQHILNEKIAILHSERAK